MSVYHKHLLMLNRKTFSFHAQQMCLHVLLGSHVFQGLEERVHCEAGTREGRWAVMACKCRDAWRTRLHMLGCCSKYLYSSSHEGAWQSEQL